MEKFQNERQLVIHYYQNSMETKPFTQNGSDHNHRFNTIHKDNMGNDKGVTDHMDTITDQLNIITKERDSLYVLWETSQKTIKSLEIELKAYQSNETYNLNASQTSHIIRGLKLYLESSINDYVELEAKYKEVLRLKTALENQLKNKDSEILSYKGREQDLEGRLEDMQKELNELKIQLADEHTTSEDLKSRLFVCQKELLELAQKETEAKSKVSEAMGLFDVVSQQKCEAMKKVLALTKELEESKNAVAEAKNEAMESFREDLETIKEKYNEKMADMVSHIKNLDAELEAKGALLAKAMREKKAVKPQLAAAEEKINTLFQQLLEVENRNRLLVCEEQSLSAELLRKKEEFEREQKRRDWEEQLLKTQCDEYKLQIDYLQKSLEETHNLVDTLQRMLFSNCEFSQKLIATKEEELSELNKLMEHQIHLNKKWKKTYVEMAAKLKHRLRHMKKQNEALKNKREASISSSDTTPTISENSASCARPTDN